MKPATTQIRKLDFATSICRHDKVLTHTNQEAKMTPEKETAKHIVFDREPPPIRVGGYTISRHNDESSLIQNDDGEGGQFSDMDFSNMIDSLFRSKL